MTNTPFINESNNRKSCHAVSTDGGAVASAITENQKCIRDKVIKAFSDKQHELLSDACAELKKLELGIREVIESNRGGETGMHGFIAEHLEVGLGNAKSIMNGDGLRYVLLDDNGRDDILVDSIPVQMKFVQKALSLDAVKEHMIKYPDAISDGELYMIPKDYWEKLQILWNMTSEEAGKLRNTDYSLWQKLHELYDEGLNADRLCAAEFDYNSAQREMYQNTIDDCRHDIVQKHDDAIEKITLENAPSLCEALKNIGMGAAIEGVLEGTILIIEKHYEGTDLGDYSKADVMDVAKSVVKGSVCGGIRSGVVYLAVNFSPIPAGVASGVVTIAEKSIEIGINAHNGDISKDKAKEELISSIIEVSVTTVFAMVGAKAFKKNRIVGSMIGTAAAKAVIYAGRKIHEFTIEKKCA